MKWMIASDVHGSAYYCKKLLEAFAQEGADRLVLLGDILYHGPRNDLPREYDPKQVTAMLNGCRDKILCVRGNCDAEVDQMVLEFPVLAEYALLDLGERLVYATHGHKYGPDCLPPLRNGDVLLCGHTHVSACREIDGIWYLNPGSVSMPKEESVPGYMTLEDGCFAWRDFEGHTLLTFVPGE